MVEKREKLAKSFCAIIFINTERPKLLDGKRRPVLCVVRNRIVWYGNGIST